MSTNGQLPAPKPGAPQPGAPQPDPQTALPRPVVLRAADLPAGARYPLHRHSWGQLVYASDGALLVETREGGWLAPPQRAVWTPPQVDHAVQASTRAAFRSLYIARAAAADLPKRVTVLEVEPLLRELIRAVEALPTDYDEGGAAGRLVAVLLDRLRAAAAAPAALHLPVPKDRRLAGIAAALIADPSDDRPLEAFAAQAGASARTLARLFLRETGLSFGRWRTRRRLLAAVERLSDGAAVTTVAYDLGYESPSAFVAMVKRETGRTPTKLVARAAARG